MGVAQCVPDRLGAAGGAVALHGLGPGTVRRRRPVQLPSSWAYWPTCPRSSERVSRCATSVSYTSPEIGELLGTSAGTVRVQLHRAHATLRHTIMEAEHA